jgi:Prolyl-tRNA synthetase
MLYSKLFGKTKKEVKKYEAKNQELLTKAGFIDQLASGIYTLLPLGKRVLTKIENIIRQEMNSIGAQEIEMPLLHPKVLWEQTQRWQTVDVLFKTKSQFNQEYGLAPTHEEIVTPLVKKFLKSGKDLPLALYHITTKFRDEPRPKSGILRGREFGMKDLYSFS